MKKIGYHITFPYKDSRLKYIYAILKNCNGYSIPTDIFIHTTVEQFPTNAIKHYTNGKLMLLFHDNDEYLPWKCRSLISIMKNDYDFVMYSGYEMIIPPKAIDYYLKYFKLCLDNKFNIGFVKTCIHKHNEYIVNLHEPLKRNYLYNTERYIICDNNHWGFWIYDKETIYKWIQSPEFDPRNIMKRKYNKKGQEKFISEKSEYGLNFPENKWFKHTIIPTTMNGTLLNLDCRVHSLIKHENLSIRFHRCVK